MFFQASRAGRASFRQHEDPSHEEDEARDEEPPQQEPEGEDLEGQCWGVAGRYATEATAGSDRWRVAPPPCGRGGLRTAVAGDCGCGWRQRADGATLG